ncbi:MAG: sensor histidine kinase [Actinomycetes bacterium]
MSTWPLRRMLGVVFAVISVVTVIIVIITAVSLVSLDHARTDRTKRYGPGLLATETLSKAYSDQETGLRGYTATGSEEFLAPYRQGLADELQQERLIRRYYSDRPDLLGRLTEVVAAARTWQHEVAAPAIAATRAGGARSTTLADIKAGKVRFDAVRSALARLQAPAQRSSTAASVTLDHQLDVLRIVLLISLGLLVALGVATWFALRRWVTDPMRRLGSEVDVVEQGDLSHQIVLDPAPADVRTLAEQVDRMRIRIVQEYALAEQAREDALRAREQLEEQAVDLQRSNTELEQFAYVASHDLQEPLRKVASFCQLLERRYKGQLDERGDQYIEFAVDGAKRMQQLINDLLAFSRVGRLTSDFIDIDLDEAVEQSIRQLAATVEEAGATVTHDPLPTVRGEGTLLVQLFQNLIGNGIKFRGEAPPRVHIAVRQDEDMWEFTCADNGIGIEPQYADKIFVIFQRLHGRDVYGGTGIGLAMCKKIVEYHGGRMWLDTSVRDGTTFRWTLPVTVTSHETTNNTTHGERTTDDDVAAGAADRGAVGGGRPR